MSMFRHAITILREELLALQSAHRALILDKSIPDRRDMMIQLVGEIQQVRAALDVLTPRAAVRSSAMREVA